jgi:hypothetical protein
MSQAVTMSSIPMAIDSPIGSNGLGLSQKPNGMINTPMATAKLTEMMSLYRPTKVGLSLKYRINRQLIQLGSSSVANHQLRLLAKPLLFKIPYYPSTLMIKGAFSSHLRVIIVCRYITSLKGSTKRHISVKNMAVIMPCSLMQRAVSFIPVPR